MRCLWAHSSVYSCCKRQRTRSLYIVVPRPSGDRYDNKNQDGITPLEGLEISIRSAKESMETLLGVWKGYSDDALTCEYLLIKAMGSSLVAAVEEEYIKKKFGCTWGMCTDRWLSPRMRFQLLGGHYIIMR